MKARREEILAQQNGDRKKKRGLPEENRFRKGGKDLTLERMEEQKQETNQGVQKKKEGTDGESAQHQAKGVS